MGKREPTMSTRSPLARLGHLESEVRVLNHEVRKLKEENEILRRRAESQHFTHKAILRQIDHLYDHLTQLIRRPAGIPRPSATQTQGVNHD